MKTKFVQCLALLGLAGMLAGCVTTKPQSYDNLRITAAAIRSAAEFGTYFAIGYDPNTKSYFQLAAVVLTSALNDKAYDPEYLKQAIANISIKEIRRPEVLMAITGALEIYKAQYAALAAGEIKRSAELEIFLTALRDGIVSGVDVHGMEIRYQVRSRR